MVSGDVSLVDDLLIFPRIIAHEISPECREKPAPDIGTTKREPQVCLLRLPIECVVEFAELSLQRFVIGLVLSLQRFAIGRVLSLQRFAIGRELSFQRFDISLQRFDIGLALSLQPIDLGL